jgi:heme/copper-type cytochrome/quinol oxidase subunit 2
MQMDPPPQNYLVWAILSTLLCCWPLGVPAIVFSTQVNSKWAMGDRAGAIESARKARTFAMWSAVIAVVGVVLYVIFVVVLGGLASLSSSSSY